MKKHRWGKDPEEDLFRIFLYGGIFASIGAGLIGLGILIFKHFNL